MNSIEGGNGFDEVRRFLEEGGNVNGRAQKGQGTLLHRAAQSENRQLIELLIRSGADLNAQTRFGDTPLHIAVQCEAEGIIATGGSYKDIEFITASLLLGAGADPNIRNVDGFSPAELIGYCYSKSLQSRFEEIIERSRRQ